MSSLTSMYARAIGVMTMTQIFHVRPTRTEDTALRCCSISVMRRVT